MYDNRTPLVFPAETDPYRSALARCGLMLGLTLLIHSALRYGVPLLLTLFSPLGAMIVRVTGASYAVQEAVNQLLSLVLSVGLLLIPFSLYGRRMSRPAVHFRGRAPWRMLLYALPLGLLCNVAGLLSTDAIRALVGRFGFVTTASGGNYPTTMAALVIYLVYSCVAAPITEEIVFRGVLLGSLTPFGERFAIITSALVFSALHGNLVQAPNTFLLGLLIGYFVVKTGSLQLGIAMHVVNNVLAHLLNLLLMHAPTGWERTALYGVLFVYALAGIVALLVYIARRGRELPFARNVYDHAPYSKARVLVQNAPMILWIVLCAIGFLSTLRFVGW